MNDSNIVEKMNRSSFGSQRARTLRASVPVTRARTVIAQAQVRQSGRTPGGNGDGATKR